MSSPVVVPQRRRSIAGPIVLIVLGILFLLGNLHLLGWLRLADLFARFWPLLLILWGVIKLYEYYQAKQEGVPPRGIGAGGVFLLIFLVILGLSASGAMRAKDEINWGALRDEIGADDDVMRMFGNDYVFEQTVEQDNIPVNASVKVVCDRGSVNITVWDEKKIKVVAHKKIFAKEQQTAESRNTQTVPQFQVTGNQVVLNANTQSSNDVGIQSDLDVYVPKEGMIEISTRRGDVAINTGHAGDVRVSNHRGDVMVEGSKGNLTISLEKGNVRVSKIDGNVLLEGRADDVDISEVTGSLRINSEVLSDMKLAAIKKSVVFQSSRTDMELASLAGDLNLDSGDLRATNITGPVKLVTRSKDIHLEEITGDVRLENANGSVELHAADKLPIGNIDVTNRRGDIHLVLPGKAGFSMQATTRKGDVQSDFSELTVNNEHGSSVVNGSVGKGGPKVQLTSDSGDIEIRKTT
jgi:DUF4097 and DUF4098 domain-containing protein YvlB